MNHLEPRNTKKINKNNKTPENWVTINFDNSYFLVLNHFNDSLIQKYFYNARCWTCWKKVKQGKLIKKTNLKVVLFEWMNQDESTTTHSLAATSESSSLSGEFSLKLLV